MQFLHHRFLDSIGTLEIATTAEQTIREGDVFSEVLDDIWNTIPAARVVVDNSRTTGNSSTVEVLLATPPSQGAPATSGGKSLSEALTAYPFVREVWREIKKRSGGSTASNNSSTSTNDPGATATCIPVTGNYDRACALEPVLIRRNYEIFASSGDEAFSTSGDEALLTSSAARAASGRAARHSLFQDAVPFVLIFLALSIFIPSQEPVKIAENKIKQPQGS
ncbi:unnamed protein product [Amoebophrya sp. A120]|nr:unnamed protein product [Amoebophrya sp. A120]|eukprot:GSA120T00013665001.1